ncbi:MAG: hypothetical protein AAGC85_20885, partial [Bacteroidota bacterium]
TQSNVEPLDQLQSYPLPRYKSGHNFVRLFNWVNNIYLAGRFKKEFSVSQSAKNSYDLQKELALNWHYSINLGNSVSARYLANLDYSEGYLYQWIKLANELPEVTCGVISLWPQTVLQDPDAGYQTPYVRRQDLPDEYYLRNEAGEFLSWNGGKFTGTKYISSSAPGKLFKNDGKAQNAYMENLISRLTRPLNWINENGEVFPYPYKESILELDSDAIKEKGKLKFSDWDSYQAYKKTSFRKYYRDQILKGSVKPSKTIFTWYGVDGGDTPTNRFKWTEAKKILTPINGNYLSTTDFYPLEPKFWKTGAGAWHGWDWMEKTRKVEIMDGDHLCSPFIAAGWSKDPTRNIRPSQWLGLLKNLTVIGAEFFYVGFFNESAGDNYPDPRNYVWQLAVPSYAQAVSTYFSEILREGKLLESTNGEPIIRHWVGDPRVVVTIRKHTSKNLYAIAASLNPNTNAPDNVEDQKIVYVSIEGEEVAITVRKQGSVYVLDRTNKESPVFWQLDSWHEAGHPLNWNINMSYEAEVFDEAANIERVTYTAKDVKSYSKFKTLTLSNSSNAIVSYEIPGRNFTNGSALLTLTAGMMETGSGNIEIQINGKTVGELEIKGGQAKYDENGYPSTQAYSIVLSDLGNLPFKLSVKCNKSGLLLDDFVLSPVTSLSK